MGLKKITSLLLALFLILNPLLLVNLYAIEKEIQVTGTVNPTSNSFNLDLSSNRPPLDEVYPGEVVDFSITVNSESYTAFPLQIKATWEDGLVEGSLGNYVEVYDYVLGSASSPLPNTDIYVDLLNREITWDVAGMAITAGQGHVFTFKLQVKPSFLTTSRILATVYADGIYKTAPSPQKNFQLYVNPLLTPTPSPTPTLTLTPTPTLSVSPTATFTPPPTFTPTPTEFLTPLPTVTLSPTPTATPTLTVTPTLTATPTFTVTPLPSITPRVTTIIKDETVVASLTPATSPSPIIETIVLEKPKFQKITIESITAKDALFTVTTSQDVSLVTRYELCETGQFPNTIKSKRNSRYHEVLFSDLKPQTVYCAFFEATNPLTTQTSSSEVFLFETASLDTQTSLLSSSTTWNGLKLSYTTTTSVYIPENEEIVISVEIENPQEIDVIDGEFVNRSVLGASTLSMANVSKVRFVETGLGVFSAQIATPFIADDYLFSLQIRTKDKKYKKAKLDYSFLISKPLKILDKQGLPIETARVLLERYEESTSRFVPFNQSFTLNSTARAFSLPYHTQKDGSLDIALSEGKYRATINAIGYVTKSQEFVLGAASNTYPSIYLDADFSITSIIQYVQESLRLGFSVFVGDLSLYFGTRILYTIGICIQLLMILILFLLLLIRFGLLNRFNSKIVIILKDIESELMSFFLSFWSLMSITTSFFFLVYQGFGIALPFLIMSVTVTLADLLFFIKKERRLLSLESLKI